jgi:hypothetical protein
MLNEYFAGVTPFSVNVPSSPTLVFNDPKEIVSVG